MHRTDRRRRGARRSLARPLAALLVASAAAMICVSAAYAAGPLDGEVFQAADDPLSTIAFGPSDPAGCDPEGPSTIPFSGSGPVTGPYPGTITVTGSFGLGAQTSSFPPDPDPHYGFPAQYGSLTSVTGTFTITSGTTTVSGTFTGLAPPLASVGRNLGSCYGTSEAVALGYSSLVSGTLIGWDANLYYTATISGPSGSTSASGGVIFRQRQTCVVSVSPAFNGCGHTGPVMSFYAATPPPTDDDPPVVIGVPDRAPNGAGWYNADVTVDWQATDPAPSSGTPSDPPSTVASTEASSVVYVSGQSCDPEGNCATGFIRLSIDKTAPTVTCGAAPRFLVNQPAAAVSASVADGLSGPVAASVSAAASTSQAGTFSVSLTGADAAGNSRTVSCSYSVGYRFEGFLAPVDSLPTVNRATAGQTLPLKWRLTDYDGVPISDPASFVSVTSGATACESSDPLDEVESYAGGSGLQYLGNGYWQFNWKTPKSYAGQCRTMRLNLADGDPSRIAEFRFK